MAEQPRDFNHWVKSVERRLQQSLRAGQSPQAARLARDVQRVREEVRNIEAGSSPVPAAPIELVVQTRVLPDLTGTNQGEVSVDFPDVVRDVNANPIEVDRYELWVNDLKEAEESQEGLGDESWRTNLVSDTSVEHWEISDMPQSKMVADLEEGKHFVAGDQLRFTVTMDMFGTFPHEDDELFHSVRLAAYQGDVEDPTWQVQKLPLGREWDNRAPQKEEFTVEGQVPEGTTRVTAHFAGNLRSGHIEFNSPTLFNMSEEAAASPLAQGWKLVSTAVESSVSYSPLTPGADYDVRVRAVASGVPGPFSVTRRVTVERDKTPPPIPSPLGLTSSGATVTASWDLLSGAGDPMPGDFSNTEVAYGYHPAPTDVVGSITNLFSQAIFETPQPGTDVDFDGTYYFRHRAVDTSGNRSGWSATSSIVPKQLVDTASMQFELDALNRERIEPLKQALNTIEPVIEDYDDRIQSAQDGAQSARDTAETLRDETLPALEGELQGLTAGQQALTTDLEDLDTRVGPALETSISEAVSEAQSNLSSFQQEWDENWDPEAISGLVERADELEGTLGSKAESSDLDQLNAHVYGRERVYTGWGEPDESTGARGVTYGWAGEPHASESIKRIDGIEVERNLARLPRAGDSPPWEASRGSISVEQGTDPFGVTAEVTRWQGTANNSGPYYRATSGDVDGASGEWLAMAVWVRPVGQDMSLRADTSVRSGSSAADTQNGSWEWYEADQWHKITGTVQTTGNYDGFQYWVRVGEGANNSEAIVDVTFLHVTVADTETDALAQVETYFDGDTVAGVTYEWAGEPHASESVKRVDGVEVARNLVANPSFETGSHGWSDSEGAALPTTHNWFPQFGSRILRPRIAGGTGEWQTRVTYEAFPPEKLRRFIAVSFWARGHSSNQDYETIRVVFRDSGGGLTYQGRQDIPAGEQWQWRHYVEHFEVPEGSSCEINLYIAPTGDTEMLYGLDGVMAATADTEAEALAQVENYFDGDTEDVLDEPATEGTIYYQTEGDEIVAIWRRTSGEWRRLPLRDEVLASVSVGKLVAGEASIDTAVIDQLWAELGTFDRLDAREGWIGGVALGDGAVAARHVDMEDFTADAGFIDNAFVNLIQGKMANFDEALIGGALLKNGAVSAEKLTLGAYDDMIPDPKFETRWWRGTPSDFHATSNNKGAKALRITPADLDARGGEIRIETPNFKAIPGEQYTLTFEMYRASGASGLDARAWGRGNTANGDWWGSVMIETLPEINGWRKIVKEFIVNNTSDLAEWSLCFRINDLGEGGDLWIANPSMRKKFGGELVVDGGIKARNLDVEEIFFDNAIGNAIAAGSAEFLELDADQITAGKINTARLDAQEVAGAVANFLTLDALEINVEELAGQIANIIEITAESIASGAISTKHLAIGNFDNLWPDDWYGEESAGDYTFAANYLALNAGNVAWFNQANPSGSSIWKSLSTLHGRRRWTIQGTEPAGQVAFRLGPGRGITVKPGEQYAFTTWVRDMSNNSELAWYIQFFRLDGSEGTGASHWQILDLRGIVHAADDTEGVTHTFTIPDVGWGTMYMVPFLRHGGPEGYTGTGIRSVMEPIIRKMVDGELLVDGGIKARHLDAEEIFFDSAVGNKVAAGVGEFLTIETGNLASNAVTADKISFGSLNGALITGLQIQTHTNNRGVKITSAGIRAFNSSGTETFTVNASNGNVSARGGTFTGGSFDGGTFTGGAFQTSPNWTSTGGASLSANSRGHFRSVNSSGQVTARLGGERNELRNLSVSALSVDGELRVGGNGEGGIVPDSGRTRFVGRTPDASDPYDTNAYGRTGMLEAFSSRSIVRISYLEPSPYGARVPIVSGHIGHGTSGNNAPIIHTRNRDATGFDAYVNVPSGSFFWIYYNAFWGDPPNSPGSVEAG